MARSITYARGDRREAIYEDDEDRLSFLRVLGDVVRDFNWRVHAYCLMSNHDYLMVEAQDGNFGEARRVFRTIPR